MLNLILIYISPCRIMETYFTPGRPGIFNAVNRSQLYPVYQVHLGALLSISALILSISTQEKLRGMKTSGGSHLAISFLFQADFLNHISVKRMKPQVAD